MNAKPGAKLVVSARSQPKLESLVDEIHSFGSEATAIVADVAVFEQVKAIAISTDVILFTSALTIFLISVDSQYGQCIVESLNSSLYYATPKNLPEL